MKYALNTDLLHVALWDHVLWSGHSSCVGKWECGTRLLLLGDKIWDSAANSFRKTVIRGSEHPHVRCCTSLVAGHRRLPTTYVTT